MQADDITNVVAFLTEFANQHGQRELSSDGSDNVIKLPYRNTKNNIYRKYCASVESQPNVNRIARNTFVLIWKKYCPNVVISKTAEDRRKKKSLILQGAENGVVVFSDHVY